MISSAWRSNPVEHVTKQGPPYVSARGWPTTSPPGRWVLAVASTHGGTTTTHQRPLPALLHARAVPGPGLMIGRVPQRLRVCAWAVRVLRQ